MSGIFGNSKEDRFHEVELDEYLDGERRDMYHTYENCKECKVEILEDSKGRQFCNCEDC